MDFSSAQMSCVLKVNVHCEGCKRKIMEVLQNLQGLYSVAIDSEQGTVKVNGRVNPNIILQVLEKYGKHGDVTSIRFDGEIREHTFLFYNGENAYIPYEVPLPCTWHGRYQYLMPPLPPPLPPPSSSGILPPPPRPLPPPQPVQPFLPAPVHRPTLVSMLPPPHVPPPAPPKPTAPPPPQQCCSIM